MRSMNKQNDVVHQHAVTTLIFYWGENTVNWALILAAVSWTPIGEVGIIMLNWTNRIVRSSSSEAVLESK